MGDPTMRRFGATRNPEEPGEPRTYDVFFSANSARWAVHDVEARSKRQAFDKVRAGDHPGEHRFVDTEGED